MGTRERRNPSADDRMIFRAVLDGREGDLSDEHYFDDRPMTATHRHRILSKYEGRSLADQTPSKGLEIGLPDGRHRVPERGELGVQARVGRILAKWDEEEAKLAADKATKALARKRYEKLRADDVRFREQFNLRPRKDK